MILAAGRGERLRPLTDRVPKPLVELDGETLIERHLRNLSAAGIGEIVINISWLGARIVETLGDGHRYGVRLFYSPEGEEPLDTGGGIFRALPMLGEGPFWVVNADVCTNFDFAAAEDMGDTLASLVLVPNPAHNPRGDFACAEGLVAAQGERLTFAGIARYRREFFEGCNAGVFSVVPLIRRRAAAGRVRAEVYRGLWHDPGTPERLAELRASLASARSR